MLPTSAAVLLFGLGLVLWLPALTFALVPPLQPGWLPDSLVRAGAWLVFAYDGALLLLLLLDVLLAFRASRPRALKVRRERPARLSVGVDNEVVLVVDNAGRLPLRVTLRDAPPAGWRAEPALLGVRVPRRGWARAS